MIGGYIIVKLSTAQGFDNLSYIFEFKQYYRDLMFGIGPTGTTLVGLT